MGIAAVAKAANIRSSLAIGLLLVLLAIVGGALVPDTFSRLQSEGLTSDSAESSRADAFLHTNFPTAAPDLVLMLRPQQPTDSAGPKRLLDALAAEPGVAQVHSFYTDTPVPELRAADGNGGLAVVSVDSDIRSPAGIHSLAEVAQKLGADAGVDVSASGRLAIDGEISELADASLAKAELIAAPIVAVILILVFGSLWAAALPLIAGVLSVLVAMLLVNVLARLTDVSTFALNLSTAVGFGLAIDYSLFMVSRFREARAQGLTAPQARRLCLATSGKTIVFSGVTLILSLSALLAFPGYFLKSLAFSGIATVAAVIVVTVTLIPALLVLLGDRATRRYRWSRWATVEHTATDNSPHADAPPAARSKTRSVVAVVLITVALLAAAAPFLKANFVLQDYRELPDGNPGRVAAEQLSAQYPQLNIADQVLVVLPDSDTPGGNRTLAQQIAAVEHVTEVRGLHGTLGVVSQPPSPYDASFAPQPGQRGTWMTVTLNVDPESPSARTTIASIRAAVAPEGGLVSGHTAALVDATNGIKAKLPLAIAVIFIATAALLFLLTGSVLLPLIGVVLSVLSLGATFGALVFIFQDGNFAALLGGFTAFGAINVTAPILLFCIAYGLSMDYQMFILSRITEEHESGRSDDDAVVVGVASTKRVIGAAALLISVVLAAMATSGLTYLKILGAGLAIAVIVDAFIVRLYLLPAVMRLCGRWAWYRPQFLDRPYAAFKLSDAQPPKQPLHPAP